MTPIFKNGKLTKEAIDRIRKHRDGTDDTPGVAYRRVGHTELVGRKLIKCPYCTELLTHVERATVVQIYRFQKGKQNKQIPGMILKRCDVCKNEVGIVISK